MKRVYGQVAVIAAEDGFGVTLDGHRLRTPQGASLCLCTPELAAAVAAEWDAQ